MTTATVKFQTTKKLTASKISRLQPARTSLLQGQCACGGTPGLTGECEECARKKRFGLQTKLKVSEPGALRLGSQCPRNPLPVSRARKNGGKPLRPRVRHLFKGLTFAKTGEVVLDFQFDIGGGLKLETNLKVGVNPDDYSQVRKADVGIGVAGHF